MGDTWDYQGTFLPRSRDEELELAWCAGFFDGEGCVTANVSKNRKTFTILLIVAQSGTTEHLERFRNAVGFGTINGPYERQDGGRRQAMWHWRAAGRDAVSVMDKLRPYLCSPKLEKLDRIVLERMKGS